MYSYQPAANGNPYAPQQPGFFNPMAAGMPGATSYSQSPMPYSDQQVPQPPVPQQVPQPNKVEAAVNAWLDERGVDLSQFGGNINTLLDGLYEGAKKGIDLEEQLKAAKSAQQPAEPQPADVNWREYEKWLTTNEQGEIVPADNAPYAIPYAAVKQANEVARQVQSFRSDPTGFLKQNVASLVEEKAREIAEQKWQEFQAQQALDNSFESFIERNASWMYENGDRNGKLTEAGKKYADTVKAAEDAGVRPEHALEYAWQNFQGSFLRDALESRLQQYQQSQSAYAQNTNQGIGADGMYRPNQDPAQQVAAPQPRNPDGTFASSGQQQGYSPSWQQAPPAAAAANGSQFQPGYASPQNTGQAMPPAAMPVQESTPQPAQVQESSSSPQQTFSQEHGLNAAFEPLHRSGSNASGLGEDLDLSDLETIQTEVASRYGVDMSIN